MTNASQDLNEYLQCLGFGSKAYEASPIQGAPPKGAESGVDQEPLNLQNYLDKSWSLDSKIQVVAEIFQPSSPAERELIEKMLGAIQLDQSKVQILALDPGEMSRAESLATAISNQPHLESILLLVGPRFRSIVGPRAGQPGQNWLVSHSATECLDNPGLKKIVWEDLKSFKGMLNR